MVPVMGTNNHLLFRSLPKISKEDFELIFSALDDSGDFKVSSGLLLVGCTLELLGLAKHVFCFIF